MNNDIAKKLEKFENFIQTVLKRDLKEIDDTLKKKREDFEDWQAVKNQTKVLKCASDDDDLTLQLNLGLNIYGTVTVEERSSVLIDIGLGCRLLMDYDEACKYADIRLKLLLKEIDHYKNLAVKVKAYIKLTLLAINELNNAQK